MIATDWVDPTLTPCFSYVFINYTNLMLLLTRRTRLMQYGIQPLATRGIFWLGRCRDGEGSQDN